MCTSTLNDFSNYIIRIYTNIILKKLSVFIGQKTGLTDGSITIYTPQLAT